MLYSQGLKTIHLVFGVSALIPRYYLITFLGGYIIYTIEQKNRLEVIDEELENLNSAIASSPRGKLICTQNAGRYKWYVREENKLTYIPKKERMLAQKLAYKKYAEARIRYLEAEKKCISNNIKDISKYAYELERIYQHDEYMNLLATYKVRGKNKYEAWMNEEYERNMSHPEKLIHPSVRGLKVRSKAESMIAMALEQRGIPFRYEWVYLIEGFKFYPDFTVINIKTGKMLRWEHFGRMDDPEYINSFEHKIPFLIKGGLIPGNNLIMTFETKNNPLTYETIMEIIDFYLV